MSAKWVGIDAKTNEHVVVIGEGGVANRVRTVLRKPASDRWNVDAVKAMQASPRVPNPENLRQAKVMPERLTKKMEVEGDGSKIQEQVRRFQEFKFREFKITKGILEKFVFSDKCKGCGAAASGTEARRHTDDCRQRLEQLVRDDEVLRVRLDMRDVRIISSILRHSKKKLRTPIVKMLTRSVTKAKGKWIVERKSRTKITSGDDCSCWRLKRNSWTSFLNGVSTVRPDTI